MIKVEHDEGQVQSHEVQEEEAYAGRGRRRRVNEGVAAVPDETASLRAAHAVAQAQAFGEMEQARVMGLELLQAKADVAKLQAEAKLKDEALQAKETLLQAIIRSKDEQMSLLQRSKDDLQLSTDPVIESKDVVIRSKEEQLSLLQLSKDAVIDVKDQLLQTKDAEIRRLHTGLVRCSAEFAAPAPAPALGCVASSGPGFLRTFGSYGKSKKQFHSPTFMYGTTRATLSPTKAIIACKLFESATALSAAL